MPMATNYLDFVCSWGAMLLGHAHPAVTAAIAEQAQRGTSFGVTTELEVELATLITRAIPSSKKSASSPAAPKPP